LKQQSHTSLVKILLIMITTVLVMTGCSSSNNSNGGDEKAFISNNDQVQLTLAKSWVEDPDLSKQAILGLSERKKEKYVMVNTVAKSDLADDFTLADYKSLFIDTTLPSVKDFEESNNKEITVDSAQALLFEISGEVQKVKVHYLVALLEKGDSFYQIVTWSTKSKFDSNKEELLKAIESLKILKETPPASATPSESANSSKDDDDHAETTTMTSDDKKIEITLPAYMSKELELSPIADIQASRSLQEEYMMVIREDKGEFADNITLNDYYDAIIANMTESLVNSSQTEPQDIQINGQPALQFELSGEVDKIKISYLLTLVETDGNFNQLLFWTLQNRMDDKREMFIEAASTFTEVQ
jgi:hypothetical protein